MITSTDIANLLYRDCGVFNIPIVPHGEKITGELKEERIVIHSKKQQPGDIWNDSFAEVNFCIPDLTPSNANTIRLNEIERLAYAYLDDVAGSYDGTEYFYSVESVGMEQDVSLQCHYINVRIIFEVLNVIN